MPTFGIEVDFEAYCYACGAGICQNVTTSKTLKRQLECISVEPCPTCLKKKFEAGSESRQDEIQTLENKISDLEEKISELIPTNS